MSETRKKALPTLGAFLLLWALISIPAYAQDLVKHEKCIETLQKMFAYKIQEDTCQIKYNIAEEMAQQFGKDKCDSVVNIERGTAAAKSAMDRELESFRLAGREKYCSLKSIFHMDLRNMYDFIEKEYGKKE
jgi:hypothetical protein